MQARSGSLSLRIYARAAVRHAHPHHQAVLPALGALAMDIGGRSGTVDEAHGVLIVGDTPHAFASPGENRFIVLDLPAAGLPDGVLAAAAAQPFFAIDAALRSLLRYLDDTVGQGGLHGAAAHHASALLTAAIAGRLAPSGRPALGIADALALVERRYADPIEVADMAAAAGMSLSRFHAAFRQATATTPADHVAEVRLDRATALLRGTRLPIVEIALAVGFSDQTALTRAFRRRRGITPGGLRRR